MRLRYILSETGANMLRNLAMVVSVVIVTAVSLAFVGTGLLVQRQAEVIRHDLLSSSQVTVYLCSRYSTAATCANGAANADQQADLEAALTGADLKPYVADYTVRSQDEALAQYQEQFGDDAFSQQATADDMPVSFVITLADPEESDAVTQYFSGREGVDEVTDLLAVYKPLISLLNQVTVVAIAFAAFMLVAAVLLIATTIRMSAQNRKRETQIMRSVGASNFFIRIPFVLEGALAALLGALVSSGILYAAVHYGIGQWVAPRLGAQFRLIGDADVAVIAPLVVVVGVVLAILASAISLNRYLKD